MREAVARREAEAQTIKENSSIFIDSAESVRRDCLRILQVDDDVNLLEVSKQILMIENDFEIEAAISVDDAFKKMKQQTFDAIVSDYEMPQKNGLEFLKELREQQNQIPFILFTGRGREDVAAKALNLGADSYINKNGSPETVYCELAHAIKKTVERSKSIKQLAASESRYRELVEKSLQGIIVVKGSPLRLVFANDAIGKMLGYSSQELLSLSSEEIMGILYPEDRTIYFEQMKDPLLGKPTEPCYEVRAVRKDGSIIWLKAFLNQTDYDGQYAIQGMFLDITESMNNSEILRESEQRYRELANCLPDIVFETDIHGQLEFANEKAAEISGYSLSEIETGLNILQFIVPEDREDAKKKIAQLLAGSSYSRSEYRFLRKDGTTFPALITATSRLCKSKVTGLRGIVIDISERKKIEEKQKRLQIKLNEYSEHLKWLVDLRTAQLKAANEQLVKSERLAAIGELAGMVGHDLRNPLTVIKNAVYYLKKKGNTISAVQSQEMLEIIDKAMIHSNNIINDLLEYSREMRLELTRCSARTLVDETLAMIEVPERIQVLNSVHGKTIIWVNDDKMMRVFLNLIKNAIDAMPKKGMLEIRSRQTKDYTEIDFMDSGTGIPQETLCKLFSPLFTTKAQGMGFGLAICKRIVEAHGGTITVETQLSKGTKFTIRLPNEPKVNIEKN